MTDNTPAADYLNLKVKSQDGEEVFFKIKKATQFKKLMDAYCARQNVPFPLYRSSKHKTSGSSSMESASWRLRPLLT
jgi:hypothetical protein